MTQNEPASIFALTASIQNVLGQAQRQIEFAAVGVISRLSPRDVEELRGRTQPFPQLSCTAIGVAGFGSAGTFDGLQRRSQTATKFEFLSLAIGVCGCEAVVEDSRFVGISVHVSQRSRPTTGLAQPKRAFRRWLPRYSRQGGARSCCDVRCRP